MSSPTEGGCACGKVRYSFEGDAVSSAMCHCTSCRRTSGSAYSTTIVVPLPKFTLLTGSPKKYAHKGDSGKDCINYFCGDCGSLVYIKSDAGPDLVFVKTGSLDDLSLNETKYKPQVALYCRDKYSWLPDIEGVVKVEGGPKV